MPVKRHRQGEYQSGLQTVHIRISDMKKVILLLILIFALRFISRGNEGYRFEHLTVEDGLSRNTVVAIVQDKYGYMWFATWNGLNRYNGYEFEVFKTDLTDSLSISTNRVEMLALDDSLNVWARTFDGINNKFNYANETFTRYPENSSLLSDSLKARLFKKWQYEVSGDSYI